MFFIGLYCGVDSITAVSNGAQVMHLITVVLIGLSMGTTVRTARAVGADDKTMAARVAGITVIFFSLLAVVLTVVLLAAHTLIVRAMDTPVEAVASTRSYLLVCFSGIPFIVAYNVIASIFRGLGDSRSPMYFVVVACVVNVLLDWLFIGLLGWGPVGAALATTLSQVASVAVAVFSIISHHASLPVGRSDLRFHRDTLRNILGIGVPVALQDGFIQVAFIAITVIANGRGLVDAAAVGIVEKLIGLLFIVPSALLSTVSAVSAQCLGSGNIERARQTVRYSVYIASGFGLAVSVLFQFIPEHAMRLFTADAVVIAQGSDYLQSYVIDCFLAGIHFCFSGYFVAFHFFLSQCRVDRFRPFASGLSFFRSLSGNALSHGVSFTDRFFSFGGYLLDGLLSAASSQEDAVKPLKTCCMKAYAPQCSLSWRLYHGVSAWE